MSLDLAVSPAPAKAKDSGDRFSVKTEAVRIQELSLAAESERRGSPKRKLRSGPVPTDLAPLSMEIPPDRKRSNKRALLSSALDDRRRDGESLKAEGLLVVAEQVDRKTQGPPVFRTLGSIHCVLVNKQDGLFLETVSNDSHHTIVLDVGAMDLVHEPFRHDRKFQLIYRPGNLSSSGGRLRAASYVFMASSTEEYNLWVNGIRKHQNWQVSAACTDDGDGERVAGDSGMGVNGELAGSFRSQQSEEGTSTPRDELSQQGQESLQQEQPSIGEFVYYTPRIKHFILIRHGHYINAHVPQVSDSEQVLSQMGRQQAGFTGKYLGMLLSRIPTRHGVSIYHSDMTRAVETAAIIGNDVGEVTLNANRLLREGWPGTPYSTGFPVGGDAAARKNSSFGAAMQERARLDTERMDSAFTTFFSSFAEVEEEEDEESYCVLVCHANLIRFFLCRALGVDAASTWGHFEINHCGVTRIDMCANRPIKVVAVNETGHLPQSLITSSEDHL
ncbi:Serine/threonine-protein phosphatase pgam5, mitochondrial [Phytophthora boehmeriae]|uniref:Serine/threonine-protein phosphatase PGAM5, mitochondrial n=1 Tax=Phytophthora boehmeriae TaxID=109152 RepID=A0A8T1X4C4_9STRA|nr:Serine/threonine-protein phosphatase pgam5, mitochondrial [Phytophthora boehmeriae]